ncbi:MAG TPA: hypothetical protein VFV93_05295, partial [Thermomicrobiales bacterium]|nr:hypothetical protein [Thermomicrobiales bacterium]
GYDYIAATVRNMLPMILKTRIASADEIDIATLADRLRIATTAADSVVKMPDFVSAWSRKPFVTDSSKEETTCEKPASADEPATSAIATPSSLNGEDEPSAVHAAATWTHSTG